MFPIKNAFPELECNFHYSGECVSLYSLKLYNSETIYFKNLLLSQSFFYFYSFTQLNSSLDKLNFSVTPSEV